MYQISIFVRVLKGVKRDGFLQFFCRIGLEKIKRITYMLLVPIKYVAPHFLTKLWRRLSGYDRAMDDLVAENIPRIQSGALNKQKKLFVDCGVNEGFVLRRFIDGLNDFNFIGFEIQKELLPFAARVNPEAILHNRAISNRNGLIPMYIAKSSGVNFRGGSSTNPDKLPEVNRMEQTFVDAVRFVDFLAEQRESHGYDFIAVKMDIEGSEYQVIEDLWGQFEKDEQNFIDYLMIEFHPEVLGDQSDHEGYEKKLIEMGITVIRWI